MSLLSLNDLCLTFAGPALLDSVNLQINDGERLGLVGRNGAGKSTLLKILEGTLAPDSGDVARQPRLRIAGLPQDVPSDLSGSVRAYLHEASGATTSDQSWAIETRIDQVAHDLMLNLDAAIESLSAGSKRRVLLAAALVRDPDLLILDEPTNHLDIDAIRQLEDTLQRRRGALVFVTHDRSFLRTVATRILDLDRGAIRSYPCSYDAYVEQRDEALRVEAEQAKLFDKKLALEEAWLRRGIKARRTRNEGRVRDLEALRLERGARRDETARVKAQLIEAERSGRIALTCRDVTYGFAEAPIVRDLSATILRGDRIGIMGPNGCGKTTLIRLLLGELVPQQGTVTAGTKLEIAHFEQLHDTLDDTKSVIENVAGGRDMIPVGTGDRHVVGYLRDFLFTPEQVQGAVTRLSGGERRRLQLARVLSRPCNMLVLDEPTNDLDLETLELIEEVLLEFQGTLLLVSHDRAFIDNVVTSTIVCEGPGEWNEYVGGYEDWLRQRKPPAGALAPVMKPTRPSAEREPTRRRRIGFKEKRELGELPGQIEGLEAEKERLCALMASPGFYASRGDEVAQVKQQLASLEAALQTAYARWVELETLATSKE
jgi:ATP-binding cassette subfamily F protein uup